MKIERDEKLKNYWSTVMPIILTTLGSVLLYLMRIKLSSAFVSIIFNLFFLLEISRRKPWNQLNQREKEIVRNLWTFNAIFPGFVFTAVFHNVLFPSSLSLYFIATGSIITGFIGWYFIHNGISEKHVSKFLEYGGQLWKV